MTMHKGIKKESHTIVRKFHTLCTIIFLWYIFSFFSFIRIGIKDVGKIYDEFGMFRVLDDVGVYDEFGRFRVLDDVGVYDEFGRFMV